MINNSFEKQIREKLNGTELAPSEGLLDTIFEKRAAKARPASGFVKTGWVLAAAVLAVTVGVWILNDQNGKLSNTPVAVSTPDYQDVPQNNKPSDATLSSENAGQNNSAELTQPSKQAQQTQQFEGSRQTSPDRPRASSQIKSSSLAGSSHTIATHSTTSANKNNKGFNDQPDLNAYFNVDAANRPVIDREQHKGNSHVYVYHAVNPNTVELAEVRSAPTAQIQKFSHNFESPDFESAPQIALKSQNPKNNKRPLFIDLLYVPGLSTFSASDATANAALYNQINAIGFNQQFGVRVSMPVSRRFNVFAGLLQNQQVSRYSGEMTYETSQQVIKQQTKFINDPIRGVIQVVTYDTQHVKKNNSHQVDHNNMYSVFRMPLGMSYNFGLGKFDFSVNAALDVNYLSSSKGLLFNRETQQMTAFSSNRTSMNIGSSLSLMSAYQLSNRFRLILEPGLQHMNLKSKHTGHAVNERFINFNLALGLRYTVF